MKKCYFIIAIVFIFFSAVMALCIGIGFMTQFYDPNRPFEDMSLTGTIYMTIAGASNLAIVVCGLITLINNKNKLGIVILTYLSGIIMLSCSLTPILHTDKSVFVGLAVTAGTFNIIMGTVFLAYFNSENIKPCATNKTKRKTKRVKTYDEQFNKLVADEEVLSATSESAQCDLSCAQQTEQSKASSSSNKRAIITPVLLSTVVLYCIVALPIISSVYNHEIYGYVIDSIARYSGYEFLEDYIDYLPDTYKDTMRIKKEYNNVQFYLYDNSVAKPKCYIELNKIQKADSRWNFEKIFNNISLDDIYNVRWKGDRAILDNGFTVINPYLYLEITDIDDSKALFVYLPNNKDYNKSYYFYEEFELNSTIIGYKNKSDASDIFRAYNISNIKFNLDSNFISIDVYCYSNDMTYVLKYQNE